MAWAVLPTARFWFKDFAGAVVTGARPVAEAANSGLCRLDVFVITSSFRFFSARTVEWHLTRVYRKLEVYSRGELIRLFVGASAIEGPPPG